MMQANYIGAVALVVIGFYAMAMKRDIIKIVVGMGLSLIHISCASSSWICLRSSPATA